MSDDPITRTMLARRLDGRRVRRTITVVRDEDGGIIADVEDEEIEHEAPQVEDQRPAARGDRAPHRQDHAFAGVIGDPDALRQR